MKSIGTKKAAVKLGKSAAKVLIYTFFIVISLVSFSINNQGEPCPEHPNLVELSPSGVLYLSGNHPFYGKNIGAILSLNPKTGETIAYSYPLLTSDNLNFDKFLPKTMFYMGTNNNLYIAYDRGEENDGILVLPKELIKSQNRTITKKTEEKAGFGKVALITVSETDGYIRLVSTKIISLKIEKKSKIIASGEVEYRITDIRLDDRGYLFPSVKNEIFTKKIEFNNEEFPANLTLSLIKQKIYEKYGILQAKSDNSGNIYIVENGKLEKLYPTTTKFYKGNSIKSFSSENGKVFVLESLGNAAKVITLDGENLTKIGEAVLNVIDPAGILVTDGTTYITSSKGNYLYTKRESVETKSYLCSAGGHTGGDKLSVKILTPINNYKTENSSVVVNGQVNFGDAKVKLNGEDVELSGLYFSKEIQLNIGENQITATAARNEQTASDSITVKRLSPLSITITSPQNNQLFKAPLISVTGTVSEQGCSVTVNGFPASVNGTIYTANNIPLEVGQNTITAIATKEGRTTFTTITVTRKEDKPLTLTITSPLNNATLSEPTTLVTGTISEQGCSVTVNGQNATVTGTTYKLSALPLTIGQNTITVVATKDSKTATQSITVTREQGQNTELSVKITSPEKGYGQKETEFSITGTVTEGAQVSVNGQIATVTGTTFSVIVTFTTDGENTIKATAKKADKTAEDEVLVVLDRIPPEITFQNIENNILINKKQLDIQGVVYDNYDKFPEVTFKAVTKQTENNFFSFDNVKFTEGENEIEYSANDKFGNRVNGTIKVNVDTIPPEVTINSSDFIFKTADEVVKGIYSDNLELSKAELIINGSKVFEKTLTNETTAQGLTNILVKPEENINFLKIKAVAEDKAGNTGEIEKIVPVYEKKYLYAHIFNDKTGHLINGNLQAKNIINKKFRKFAEMKEETPFKIGIFTDSIGGALISVSKTGFTEVRRRIGIFEEENRLFDIRLTPLAESVSVNSEAKTIELEDGNVEIQENTFSEEGNLNITEISGQGLIWFLPEGYSPVRTFDIRFNGNYNQTFYKPLVVNASNVLFIEQNDSLTLVKYNYETNNWDVAENSLHCQNKEIAVNIVTAGQYSIVLKDRTGDFTTAKIGISAEGAKNGKSTQRAQRGDAECAKGVQNSKLKTQHFAEGKTSQPESWSLKTEKLQIQHPTSNIQHSRANFSRISESGKISSWTVPATSFVAPDVKSTGHISIKGVDEFTSGTKIRAEFVESYNYYDSGTLQKEIVNQDMVLYTYPGNEEMEPELHCQFPVIPTEKISRKTISSGEIKISFFERKVTLDSEIINPLYSYEITSQNGVSAYFAEGAVSSEGYVEIKDQQLEFPNTGEMETGPSFTLTIDKTNIVKPPVLSVHWNAQSEKSGGTYLVCKHLPFLGQGKLQVISKAKQTTLSTGETVLQTINTAELSGLTETGTYIFVYVPEPIGFVKGIVAFNGNPVSNALCSYEKYIFGALTDSLGQYILPVPLTETEIKAFSKNLNASGIKTVTASANNVVELNIDLQTTEFSLLQVIPENNSLLMNFTPTFQLKFNTSLLENQNLESIVNLSGASLSIESGKDTISARPTAPLQPGTTYTLTIKSGENGLKNIYGFPLQEDINLTFKTKTTITYAPFNLSQLIVQEIKKNGNTVPVAKLKIFTVENTLPTGSVVDLVDENTFSSFSVTIGTNGKLDEEIFGFPGDMLTVEVQLPNGENLSGILTRCQLQVAEGEKSRFYVDSNGGVLKGDGGIQLIVPRGALTKGQKLTFGMLNSAEKQEIETKFPLSQEEINGGVSSLAKFLVSFDDEKAKLNMPMVLKIPVENLPPDESTTTFPLVEYRENVELPIIDENTGLPVLNGNGDGIATAIKNVTLVIDKAVRQESFTARGQNRGKGIFTIEGGISAEGAKNGEITQSEGNTSLSLKTKGTVGATNKTENRTLNTEHYKQTLNYFLVKLNVMQLEGGLSRFATSVLVSGMMYDEGTEKPVDGLVFKGFSNGAHSFGAVVRGGRFDFPIYSADCPAFVLGISTPLNGSGYGALTESGSFSSQQMNYCQYRIYTSKPRFVEVGDTTPPSFKTEYRILDENGEWDKVETEKYLLTGIAPLNASLEIRVLEVEDNLDPAPTVTIKNNGEQLVVNNNDGIYTTIIQNGEISQRRGDAKVSMSAEGAKGIQNSKLTTQHFAEGKAFQPKRYFPTEHRTQNTKHLNRTDSAGTSSVEIEVTDSSGNTNKTLKDVYFGITGGDSLPGAPKVLKEACLPKDRTADIPVWTDCYIMLTEPVSVDLAGNEFSIEQTKDGENYVQVPELEIKTEALGEQEGYTPSFYLTFSKSLKFDKNYRLKIKNLKDKDDEYLDQDFVVGSQNNRTPAYIYFKTSKPESHSLESNAVGLADIQFYDGLAWCATVVNPGNTSDKLSYVEIYKIDEKNNIKKPVFKLKLFGQPKALAVTKKQEPVYDENGKQVETKTYYTLAVIRKRSHSYNSVIYIYKLKCDKKKNKFTSEFQGKTFHALSYSQNGNGGSAHSLEIRGRILFAGVATGVYGNSDTVSPGSGIRVYNIDKIISEFPTLDSYDRMNISYGRGLNVGLADFIKTPGFCWDFDLFNNEKNGLQLYGIIGDGSRFHEVLGADLTDLSQDLGQFITDTETKIDGRIKNRQPLENTAPYMVEVKEHFQYKDQKDLDASGKPKEKTITLAVVRANDWSEEAKNKVYLLDVTDVYSPFKILATLEFSGTDIGYVFTDKMQNIIGVTLKNGISYYYNIANPYTPNLFYTAGEEGTPGFSARGINDGVVFGMSKGKLSVLNFNPDMFKYYGFKGVIPSQYKNLTEEVQYREDIDLFIYEKMENNQIIPSNSKFKLNYELLDKCLTTVKIQEINGKNEKIGKEKTILSNKLVNANEKITITLKPSDLFENIEKYQKTFGKETLARSKKYIYTIEATPIKSSQIIRKTGKILLKKHIRAIKNGEKLENNIHSYFGHLIIDKNLITLNSPENQLSITRTYTNLGNEETALEPGGAGVKYNLFPSLTKIDDKTYYLSYGNYRGQYFTKEGDTYTPEKGYFGELKKEKNDTYIYTAVTGEKLIFEQLEPQKVNSDTEETQYYIDPYNGNITNTAPNISEIQLLSGKKIKYNYNKETGRLETIEDILGRKIGITYTYNTGCYRIKEIKYGNYYKIENTYTETTGDLQQTIYSGELTNGNSKTYIEKYEYENEGSLKHNLKTYINFDKEQIIYTYKLIEDKTQIDNEGNYLIKEERIDKIQYPENLITTYKVEETNERKTTITQQQGQESTTIQYKFGQNRNLKEQTTPLGTTTYSNYDENTKLPKTINYPDGRTLTLTYDQLGNITKKTITKGTETNTETYQYHENSNVLTEIKTKTGTHQYLYDTKGITLTEEKFNGITIKTYSNHNSYGQPEEITNNHNETTTITYENHNLWNLYRNQHLQRTWNVNLWKRQQR